MPDIMFLRHGLHLMESVQYRGYWWPEGDKGNKVPGVLNFQPTSRPELSLFSNFYPPNAPASGHEIADMTVDMIHGLTEGAERVTLLNPRRTSIPIQSGHHGTLQPSTWIGDIVLDGFPFERNKPTLDRISVQFYGQDKWARWGSIDSDRNFSDFPIWNTGDSFEITYEQPASLSTYIDNTEVRFGVSATQQHDRYERAAIELDHEFKIIPKRPRVSIFEYHEHITRLQNFVTFGLGTPTYPSSVSGSISDVSGESYDVQMYFPIENTPEDVSVHPDRMLFRGGDLAAQYDYVMHQWYQRSEEISEVYQLYFETVFGTGLHSRNRFLNLAHALEAYHRTRWMDTYIMPGKFDDMYDDLMDIIARDPASAFSPLQPNTEENLRDRYGLPNDFVVALRNGTLKYANEVSLGRRLKDILQRYGHLIDGLPFSVKENVRDVVDTRNYFSHWDDNIPRASGTELVELIWGLQQLIEACLLDEIGIPRRQLRTRLTSRYDGKWVSN